MLRIFDNPDIHNFLFADEPIHLSYLANPQLKQSAIACSFNETKVDPTPSPQNSMSDRFAGDFFLTPAFTYNHITFGFGVMNNVFYPAQAWNTPETAMNALGECRFVKNSKEGYNIVIAYYGTECSRIEYVKTVSTTTQARCVIGTKISSFRDATKGGSCNVDAVFPTVLLLQTSFEHRDCPFCNSDHSQCKCQLQFATPFHPLDHSSFLANTLSEFGNYMGVSHVTMYREGAAMCMGALGSRLSFAPSAEDDLVDRLRTLAISRHALIQDPAPSLSIQQDVPEEPRSDQVNITDEIFDQSDQQQLSQQNSTNAIVTDLPCPLLATDLNFDADLEQVIDITMLPTFGDSSSRTSPEILQDISSNGVASFDVSPAPVATVQQQDSHSSRDQPSQPPTSCETQPSNTPPTSSSIGKATVKDQIRKLKAELRREKNRAAAQRSNMRKKALNDSLKSSLKTTHEKLDILRSKEMLLREENIRLRQLLGKD
ncbi:hypothetical protein BWQ96_03228 [Gracilariopsis chorda]|uniref:BZIP domain-containing protein n=1 Tax=Gracilariopsis chorda TaxID=448386 RepID=A0A2V3IY12_9FLOR|nr:hypothetical protein BWQ96_03228 [Gracilariopsis chorda]|eukprot:PXF47038.1 hypothetical protein BWQ96_03228 [Gracilariopsis chorda]